MWNQATGLHCTISCKSLCHSCNVTVRTICKVSQPDESQAKIETKQVGQPLFPKSSFVEMNVLLSHFSFHITTDYEPNGQNSRPVRVLVSTSRLFSATPLVSSTPLLSHSPLMLPSPLVSEPLRFTQPLAVTQPLGLAQHSWSHRAP
jgi:hypothetical protein